MNARARMTALFRIGLASALLLASCTIRSQGVDGDGSPEAECLELFETCVDLAGESPGCTEVFEFCHGSAQGTGTGGTDDAGGCEQGFIDCLQGGGSAESCQPLLDMCMPPTTTTGTECIEGDPACDGDSEGDDTTNPECNPDDGSCDEATACEQRFADCVELIGEESVCDEIRSSCLAGDCDRALATCGDFVESPDLCEQLTGCSFETPPDECSTIRTDCENQGYTDSECRQLWPDHPQCFDELDCQWYLDECISVFPEEFCNDAQEACNLGVLDSVFECDSFFDARCDEAGLNDNECGSGRNACEQGFEGVEFCQGTTLWEDPAQWLQELAECNQWT